MKKTIKKILKEETQRKANETHVVEFLMEGLPTQLTESQHKELLSEALGVIGAIKTFLTSHKVAEFLTVLAKWVSKVTGLDKNKECGTEDSKCAEDLIEKAQKKLHDIHHWLEEKIYYVAAMIKFRKLKPSKEQISESKKLGDLLFTSVIVTFLIMYTSLFGAAVAAGAFAKATWPLIGTVAKIADLKPLYDKYIGQLKSETS